MRHLLRDRTAARLTVCVGLALLVGDFAHFQALASPIHSDLGQVWYAARAVLHGQDPYPLIGPGKAFEWLNGFYYPLPAVLLLIPLTPFAEPTAVAIFSGVGAGAMAWALTEHGYGPLWAFASLCAVHAFAIGQWSPLMAGATVLGPLGLVLIAKPTIGLAVFAAKPTRWAVLGGGSLIVLSFLIQPHWFAAWRASVQETSVNGGTIPYTAPVLFPGGFLILSTLLRWRRSEARLLAVLACVPQTALPYEGLLVFLAARTWRESLFLAVSSWVMRWYVHEAFVVTNALPTTLNAYGHALVPFLYLPATIMVLRRPNEGAAFAWPRVLRVTEASS